MAANTQTAARPSAATDETVTPPKPLVVVTQYCAAQPDQVMRVLADGWSYAAWVVGASHIRAVDDGWPRPGARIHHAVGAWPLLVRDHTECLEYDPTGRIALKARAWPAGEALVTLEVEPAPGGSRITMGERLTRGPAVVLRPLEPALIKPRNRESLARLAAIAHGRHG